MTPNLFGPLSGRAAIIAVVSAWLAVLPAQAGTGEARLDVGARAIWTGDLDAIVKRRFIRILVPYNKTLYMVDRGRQVGLDAERGREFESWLNARRTKGHIRLNVVFLPVARKDMLPALLEGYGDIAAGELTITEERSAKVDFAAPWLKDVKEIVVTGPTSPAMATLDDLSGKDVYLRASSAYASNLEKLNAQFAERGRAPARLAPVDEDLEDDDLLQMVAAGILPFAIVDDYQAALWAKLLPSLKARDDLVLSDDGAIAWAIRPKSPQLLKAIDEFSATHALDTSFGATLMRRYFTGPEATRDAASPEAVRRFRDLLSIFEQEGRKNGFDDLMLMAQGFQESGLDQSRRSPRGAVGVMQVLPSTAAAPPLNIRGVDKDINANVAAGAGYMRLIRDKYVAATDPLLKDPDLTLMTFAAYNAGPGNFWRMRDAAKADGLDPNRWFNNVEFEAAKLIGRETVEYVANIFKYYVAFKLAEERIDAKKPDPPSPDAPAKP